MFVALVALLGCANALNVVNSYVGRNFMTAIADRDKAQFAHHHWADMYFSELAAEEHTIRPSFTSFGSFKN